MNYVQGLVEGLTSVATGLRITLRYAVDNWTGNGAVTIQYPEQKPVIPERFRGHLVNKVENCITCRACERACPVDCFVIDGERTEAGKLRPARFDIDLSKCIYCGLCVRACPTDCLTFSHMFVTAPEHHAAEWKMRYLFRVRADQVDRKLSTTETAQLERMGHAPVDQLASEDKTLLAELEDPHGTLLLARFGYGYYTPEEKVVIEAARAEAAKKKAEADAAKKALAEAAKKTEGTP